MSLYKPGKSQIYQYDFWHRGHRFCRSTKTANRREAEAIEQQAREDAKRHVQQQAAVTSSLALNDVCNRYWQEVGQLHVGKDATFRLLGVLVQHFGKTKLLTDIRDNDVAKLVTWRRGHRVIRNKDAKPEDCPFIAPRTVNDTTEQLKKLFTRAKLWGVRFDHEPRWKEHWLKEPKERVRELHQDEADRLNAKMRSDYAPFFAFVAASGMRWNVEARDLRWSEVYWGEGQIKRKGKNDVDVVVPITSAIREILEPLRGQHPDFVFTYLCRIGRGKQRIKGTRYPLTLEGVKAEWGRLRRRAGVASGTDGFRVHDYRHDLATKLLRQTGNLKLVQHALGHANINTTTKYAHVLKTEIAAALEQVQKVPKIVPNSEQQPQHPIDEQALSETHHKVEGTVVQEFLRPLGC
jgi:integrase